MSSILIVGGGQAGLQLALGLLADRHDVTVVSNRPPEDIRSVVAYLRSVPPVASPDLPATTAPVAPASPKDGVTADARGKMVFAGACASWNQPEMLNVVVRWAGASGICTAASAPLKLNACPDTPWP